MQENSVNEYKKDEVKKAKRRGYIVLGIWGVIIVSLLIWFGSYKYWSEFSEDKWVKYPEKRAHMTADLFDEYDLAGMTEAEIVGLLGQNNNDYGYFNEDDRFVYYLGSERTIMDSEWLILDFKDGIVIEYSMVTD